MTAGNSMGGRAVGRPRGRKHAEARRRTRKLAPGVVGLCLVMILGTFTFLIASPAVAATQVGPAGPACIKCPDGVHCYPNCPPPPPPCNPNLYTVQVTHLQMSNHSTNVTISWQESPNFSNTSNWFNWGNTTSYGFTLNPSYNGVTYTVFLDFLEPQTVYYFQIEIVPSYKSCTTEYLPSSYYGTFTTLMEAIYVGQYGAVIMGVVYNANGQRAPMGLEVYVQCTGYNLWSQYTFTNAQGAYSMTPGLGQTGCTQYGKGYYIVELLNTGNIKTQWPGYWNESVVIWAVQCVNFYLPLNFVGPYVPQELEFTNSAYVTLGFNETVGVTTTYTATAAGNGQITTSSFSATNSGSATGANVETWVKYDASGTVLFNAVESRESSIQGVNFFGAIQASTTASLVNDPVSPSNVTHSEAYGNGLWYWFNITSGQIRGGSVTISGQVTDISGLDISVDASYTLPGGGSFGVSIPIQVTIATTTSYSNAFYFSVHNTNSVTHGFRAYVQGGSGTERRNNHSRLAD